MGVRFRFFFVFSFDLLLWCAVLCCTCIVLLCCCSLRTISCLSGFSLFLSFSLILLRHHLSYKFFLAIYMYVLSCVLFYLNLNTAFCKGLCAGDMSFVLVAVLGRGY
ncbi:hypothetical protein P153DRAFT_108426 [Dothidotthia symphoricarpi CBS 119687]|uniref:Uncharacterized protein n=1 Tax=Dothidotthia symphoricarpi CBS 119687 TaxID=1392245 RepID=A0A6A6ATG8_9PLEO|nr:uncharacterized protein P153DRAFT_108426 [Dothidotthia symphoricarpi CBS 119687]KAF2134264.1 hypothetical protein P153DRAFT_108426 [Dothidotthia symphoricarpi CBS 119687]